jgi:hypothetical protein
MAINLKDLYDVYGGDPTYLSPVKGNTPFEYYTNDPEFTSDALNVSRFIAQRLGAVGTTFNTTTQQCNPSPTVINITDLTVYAAFEEAVTTYGNMVYQYKIRDNYISLEGSDTLPFFNNTITYVNSNDVSSPVSWSAARSATWAEINYEPAYSQSAANGSIYVISASLANFIAPDLNFLKSFNLADNYHSSASNATYNLSQFVYNQFNKVAGRTIISGSTITVPTGNTHLYFYTTNAQIAGGTSFFRSGSIQQPIPTVYIQSNLKNALNNKLLSNNLTTITTRIAEDYGAEAGVGGSYDVKKGVLPMKAGIQDYDLNAWAAVSASLIEGDQIEVRKIFYEQAPAIVRYFDPYAGTGTGIQSLLETFGFGQMSPGINFLLMPIYFDVQKIQAIELNDQIRKAAYSFNIQNNQLKIFPIPTVDMPLFFEYITLSQKSEVVRDKRQNVVTDVMNTPYRNPLYSNINTVGRSWIFKYTLAVCREIEAHIRIQFANMSIQGVGPLQGSELIADARTEKTDLITELKEMLDQVSRKSQLERKSQEAEFTQNVIRDIPLTIYIM